LVLVSGLGRGGTKLTAARVPVKIAGVSVVFPRVQNLRPSIDTKNRAWTWVKGTPGKVAFESEGSANAPKSLWIVQAQNVRAAD